MNYIHILTLQVASLAQIRVENPRMSIPDGADLSAMGYERILPALSIPAAGPNEQVVSGAPTLQDGVWRETWLIEPMPTEAIVGAVTAAVQQRLDAFARTHAYDGILSACTYATSTVPKFAAEGQYAVTARDQTWATCYQIVGEVLQGLRPMPTLDEVMSELPTLEWPA